MIYDAGDGQGFRADLSQKGTGNRRASLDLASSIITHPEIIADTMNNCLSSGTVSCGQVDYSVLALKITPPNS
ncbi:hypothetical protein [Beijerinckia indica]|uniref:Uncharacterized protein n=1 Tax=Beijerinckia indica subsp. indica (strain ATCC 9039 / DSM 1715 / NCIMB 8712) TaxID=395963 RepID=B2IDZ7_BEII9|nr:hypothetical protein [Beijerinckia indica]ACB96933.1 hypothetical protein Bind_3376 [Beijerinckia indica subsp. indica ATCC 9039]